MIRYGIAVLVLLLTTPATGSAATQDARYLDLGLGVGFSPDMSLNDAGATAEFDMGAPIGSFAFGRSFGQRWRGELEFGYLDNDLENYFWPTGDDAVRADSNDGVRSTHLMVNGIRRFKVGALKPYLGLGLGAATTRIRTSREGTIWPEETPRERHVEDEAASFAWQAIVGFDVPLSARWDLGFDYRYWQASNIEVTAENGDELDVDHKSHSARVHVRYFFSDQVSHTQQLTAGHPQPADGVWHLSASFGGGFAMDSEFSDAQDNLDAFALGSVTVLAVERRLSRRWSLAIEAAWRKNDLEVIDFGDPLGEFGASGEVKSRSLSLNGLYQLRPERAIRPYLGAGIGLARLSYEATTLDELYLDDEDDAPAFQLLFGANIALNERLDFLAEFRTWYAHDIEVTRADGESDQTWHWVHSAQIGLRFAL
ncbi:MAG: porin family protein [Gammaproteobacteria bacterium]|nr:MAG: porin family protein [Gammaproteobacteria bacterium]